MRIKQALPALLVTLTAGCATVTTGSNQEIRVATGPPGANCILSRDGREIGQVASTPATAFVSKSGHDIAVNCAKYGRANGAAVIPADGQAAVFGNFIIGGLLGRGLDLATGSAHEYPCGVRIWLDPIYPEKPTLRPYPIALAQ